MATIDQNEKLIADAVSKLDRTILRLVWQLNVKGDKLINNAASLRKAIETRRQIAKEFAKYNLSIQDAVNYTVVLSEVEKVYAGVGIKNVIGGHDKEIVKILSRDGLNSMTALGDQYSAQVSSKVYTSVLSQGNIDDLTEEITQLLKGGTDKAGRPMEAHAKTIATTGRTEASRIVTRAKGDELGVKKYRYFGSLINDSRKWCVDHNNNIYTVETIEGWRSIKWQGKKQGDPFATQGGWNCRHKWTPIID